jgi:hypothetical protein
VTHSIISYIILDLEIVNSMQCYSTIVSLMDCITPHVGLVNGSNHVEMNGITTELERLTDVCKLNIFYFPHYRFITRRVKHNVSTKHVSCRSFWVTPIDYITSEKSNLTSHVNVGCSKCFNKSKMLVIKCLVESDNG